MNGHITHNVGSENVFGAAHDNIMEGDLSPVCTQVHIVPHVPAKGDPVAPSPNGSMDSFQIVPSSFSPATYFSSVVHTHTCIFYASTLQ